MGANRSARPAGRGAGGRDARGEERPGTWLEEELCASGCAHIAGVDEAGRGPLAGPVVAAAVILPRPCAVEGIDDSKRLTPAARDRLFDAIREHALAIGTGIVSAATIDAINILQATRLAMRHAVFSLAVAPDYVISDAVRIPDLACPQRPLIRGDQLCLSIAAASIIAKVTRDRILVALDRQYPGYGFAAHKGYGTRAHLSALIAQGACPEHRRTFSPVRLVIEQGTLFDLDSIDAVGPEDE